MARWMIIAMTPATIMVTVAISQGSIRKTGVTPWKRISEPITNDTTPPAVKIPKVVVSTSPIKSPIARTMKRMPA